MLTSPNHLSTHRPSPTTVQFTVSNAPPLKTVSAKIVFYTTLLLRLIIGLAIVLVSIAKIQSASPNDKPSSFEILFTHNPAGALSGTVAENVDWRILLPIGGAIAYLVIWRGSTEESLLVLRGLGVQTSTSSPTYLSTPTTRFIPTNMIQDIFIHEAFKGFEVRFYLAIVVEGEGEVVVVFPNLLPKRSIVEEVWRGARACLYEPKS
ncbi:MAG: hypothetical protein M1836_005864 [Candelina mexicana]|nr:MAG: hypothetical protein M1836_005864 [Candelina mexicana]